MAEQLATAWTCRGVCSFSRPHSKWQLCFIPKALHCNSPKVAYKGCKEHIYHWHCKDHWICWTMWHPCQSCSTALSYCKTLCCSGPNSKVEALGPLDKWTQAVHNNEDYKYVASKIQKCWDFFFFFGVKKGQMQSLIFHLWRYMKHASTPLDHWKFHWCGGSLNFLNFVFHLCYIYRSCFSLLTRSNQHNIIDIMDHDGILRKGRSIRVPVD